MSLTYRNLLWILRCLQFDYDNGFGSTVGRFKIDMYAQSEVEDMMMGDCGFWISSVCDKPDIGCKDSSECFLLLDSRLQEFCRNP